MKVEILWWLSGRAPAPLRIVNWALNTGWRFFVLFLFLFFFFRSMWGNLATFCLWNPESWRWFCLWNPKSWVLESGIPPKESGILLTIGIQNPCSTDKYWDPVPQWNPESTAWNPESKTVPDSGIQELFACGIPNPGGDLAFGIRNPEFWNPEYSLRNPESH